jgi:hypothetical protein
MNDSTLFDDEPVGRAGDCLHFDRYLQLFERAILPRERETPLSVGIFGPPGAGKSSLLRMLREHLAEQPERWLTVEFSPCLHRQEKTLLLPLLGLLARKYPPFEPVMQKILKIGPNFIELLSYFGVAVPAWNSGALGFMADHQPLAAGARDDLAAQIGNAVRTLTGQDKYLVFLLDDLDCLPESSQLAVFLEQLRLFLHHPRCLFFLASDQRVLRYSLEQRFPKHGRAYLAKFIQTAVELPAYPETRLLERAGLGEAAQQRYLLRVAEVLRNQPRRFKSLLGQALSEHRLLQEETARQANFPHSPRLELVLKSYLLRDLERLSPDPYQYLWWESRAQATLDPESRHKLRQEFLYALGMVDQNGEWLEQADRQLAVFLWQDLREHPFGGPRALSLYLTHSAEDNGAGRLFIERAQFEGRPRLEKVNFAGCDLRGGYFQGIQFVGCDLRGARLDDCRLQQTLFENCQLAGACFDGAEGLSSSHWRNCEGLDALAGTEVLPVLQRAAQNWQAHPEAWREAEGLALACERLGENNPALQRTAQRLRDLMAEYADRGPVEEPGDKPSGG